MVLSKSDLKTLKAELKRNSLYKTNGKNLCKELKSYSWHAALARIKSWEKKELKQILAVSKKINPLWNSPSLISPTRPVSEKFVFSFFEKNDDPEIKAIVAFGFLTGRRLADALRVQSDEICFREDSVLFTPGKSSVSKGELISLSKSGRALVRRPFSIYGSEFLGLPGYSLDAFKSFVLSQQTNQFLFSKADYFYRKRLPFAYHGLRVLQTVRLAVSDFSHEQIRSRLGWKEVSMVERYLSLFCPKDIDKCTTLSDLELLYSSTFICEDSCQIITVSDDDE